MSEPFVTVFRTTSPIDAEMVADVLSQNDIVARALGTRNAAIIGAAQNIMQLRVEVPSSQAQEACEFIEAFFAAAVPGVLIDDEADDRTDKEQADAESTDANEAGDSRGHLMALGSALVVFGGSHFYAGRAYTAVVIALGQAWAIQAMFTSCRVVTNATGGVLFCCLICYDIIGAQLAVAVRNRGQRLAGRWQLLFSLGIVLSLLGAATWVAPRVAAPQRYADPFAVPTC